MKKMPTLFEKDPNNKGRVIDTIRPECQWVLDEEGVIATRKFDGTSCAIIDGELYKRYDAKLDKRPIFGNGDHVYVTEDRQVVDDGFFEITKTFVSGVKHVDICVTGRKKTHFEPQMIKTKKPIPTGAIPCCDPDLESGHWPHWIKCERDNPADKYHFEAIYGLLTHENPNFLETGQLDGTYELCGPKIQGNPEKLKSHTLILHGSVYIDEWFFVHLLYNDFGSFLTCKQYLSEIDIEGIVFHGKDGKMCKLRKSDFGIKR